MSSTEIRVPEGLSGEDGEIVVANWVVDEGEMVDAGDLVCELMVTKVTFEIVAPASGKLEQRRSVEDVVGIGDLLGLIVTA
ncbi:MAG: lipoyl domain-containing protein [Sphingobium sp.]|nr:lipoyl domain-containing protein [Sphingobium sp.]